MPNVQGFLSCSHVIAAAEDNGDLKLFLESVCNSCTPNLSAIANNGMPTGSGRKGGVPKRKRVKAQPVQSRSVRQCLQPQSLALTLPTNSVIASQAALCSSPIPSSSQATTSSQFLLHNAVTQCGNPTSSVSHSPLVNSALLQTSTGGIVPARNSTAACGSAIYHNNRPLQHLGSLSNTTIATPTASSHSQVLVGGNVFNFSTSPMSVIPRSNEPVPNSDSCTKPFVLKVKTNQIRVCQSCRKDYSGLNDTMGLLVARAERRLVSNLITGIQFLGRESNSHYHLHMMCLKLAKPSFTGEELVIPDEVKSKLTAFQKVYLITCIQVPPPQLL